jgi:hypothetical protein
MWHCVLVWEDEYVLTVRDEYVVTKVVTKVGCWCGSI